MLSNYSLGKMKSSHFKPYSWDVTEYVSNNVVV